MTPRSNRRRGRDPESFRRREPTRVPKTVVLIVCEGKKTEPNYFDDIRKALGETQQIIQIRGDECGSDPKSIVEYAKVEKTRLLKEFGPDCKVWCVFDRDSHAKVKAALVQARDNEIEVAFSNPCIELWFLLHFQDQTAHLGRADARRELKKHVSKYAKSYPIHATIEENQSEAIRRAEKLRQDHISANREETDNPSSTVDRLIQFLESVNASS